MISKFYFKQKILGGANDLFWGILGGGGGGGNGGPLNGVYFGNYGGKIFIKNERFC